MRYSLFTILFLLTILNGYSQDNFYFSQYFQVGPAINPAFTGIDNFLDVKINYRNQWAGFDDSPSTNYIGVNGYIKKDAIQSYREYALRISNPDIIDSLSNIQSSLKSNIKHGIGGHIIYDRQGPFEQISGFFNYAIHIPIGFKTNLSIGASASITSNRIDLSKIILTKPDEDEYFQQLIAQGGKNTYFDINPGFAFYGENWYLSYAAFKAIRTSIASDEVLDYDKSIDHNILMGLKFNLSTTTKLLPSAYYSYNNKVNNQWEANVKVMFNEKPWFGVSYRNTKAMVFMAGVYINNVFNISYSYDYTLSNLNNYNNGSHELHFGLMLNKKDLKSPYLW
ncbi:MAG: PorP/SprF family type IX secretion system membrane protein [Cytophagales bacterium]|nr:PorP/SprF family type IX secretion system membrane protein [Cytophagales bacterium]